MYIYNNIHTCRVPWRRVSHAACWWRGHRPGGFRPGTAARRKKQHRYGCWCSIDMVSHIKDRTANYYFSRILSCSSCSRGLRSSTYGHMGIDQTYLYYTMFLGDEHQLFDVDDGTSCNDQSGILISNNDSGLYI